MAVNTPLKLAVVGHTNTGKTSLLRTLLHDSEFGEVDSRPSTTRDVLAIEVKIKRNTLIELFDTPGLEAGSELYEFVQQSAAEFRHDGPGQIQHFLTTPEAQTDFDQEAKVLRQLLNSDAALFVIDARDPVLAKYQDELSVLSRCGCPILPVLNFTAAPAQYTEAWKSALRQVNLHTYLEFDAVSPPEGGESDLLLRLSVVVPAYKQQLMALQQHRAEQQQQRWREGIHQVAELLVDVASYCEYVDAEASVLSHQQQQMQQGVRQREQHCVGELLSLYAFQLTHVELTDLDITSGLWHDDLFAADTLKNFGVQASIGATGGAAIGAGFDLLVGGASLGAGTALGAAIGGAMKGWQHYGQRLLQRWRGNEMMVIDGEILQLVMLRQLQLLQVLANRGHGSQLPIALTEDTKPRAKFIDALLALLKQARGKAQWSSLGNNAMVSDSDRKDLVRKLEEGMLNVSDVKH